MKGKIEARLCVRAPCLLIVVEDTQRVPRPLGVVGGGGPAPGTSKKGHFGEGKGRRHTVMPPCHSARRSRRRHSTTAIAEPTTTCCCAHLASARARPSPTAFAFGRGSRPTA